MENEYVDDFKGFYLIGLEDVKFDKNVNFNIIMLVGAVKHLSDRGETLITKKMIQETANLSERKYRVAIKDCQKYLKVNRIRVGRHFHHELELLKNNVKE